MAYDRSYWKDHVTDQSGEVIQQGTLLDQQHFNNMELGISDMTLAGAIMQFKAVQDGYNYADEMHTATLAQTGSKWPFNNTPTTIALAQLRESTNYGVEVTVLAYSGGRLGIQHPAAAAGAAGVSRCAGFCLVGQNGGLVIGRCLPLLEGDGPGGAGGQAVPQPVAVVLPGETGLAVDHLNGALVAGGSAGAAAVAFIFVDLDDPSFHCNASLLLWLDYTKIKSASRLNFLTKEDCL